MKPNDILAMLEEAEKLAAKNHGLRASRAGGVASAPRPADAHFKRVEREPVSNQKPDAPVEVPAQPDPVQNRAADAARQAAAAAKAPSEAPKGGTEQSIPLGKIDPVKQEVPAAQPEQQKAVSTDTPRDVTASWQDNVPTGHGSVVSKGALMVFGFLALFAIWAVTFPISSAVVAGGKIISSGKNKLVQHQDGGVVRDIMVREGQKVKAGDVLLTLDRSVKQAELTRLLARRQTLTARKTRFEAEQSGGSIAQPAAAGTGDTLTNLDGATTDATAAAAAQVQANQMLAEQRREFEAARKRLEAQLTTIRAQIETFKEQKSGLQARLDGGQRLLQLTQRELSRVRPLANDGYLPKSRMWDLEKTELEQQTAGQNIRAEIQATDQRIAEATSKLAEIQENEREKRSEEMSKIIGELAEIRDQIPAAQNAVDLTELRAPVTGTIINLVANTKGGVVPPGQPVAEIVPEGAELRAEFRVPLNKAKQVFEGQKARVTITTFNRRTYDPIDAEITFKSADSLTDEQTGESYFLARAKLLATPDKLTGLEEVTTGMATEVYVLAKPRVFASYVMQPLIDSFKRAFREI